jgi:predicted DNA-binding transcriptional regulator AlpA
MSQKLRKRQVAERYGHTTRTIERWTADGLLPQPIYIGNHPLWDIDELEKWERTRPNRPPIKLTECAA